MISIKKQPLSYCFAGNPIVFEFETDSQDPVAAEVEIGGTTHEFSYQPFGASAPYSFSLSVSELLPAFFRDIDIPEGPILSEVKDFTLDCTVKVTGLPEIKLTVFPGGIPDWLTAELAFRGKDIFSYRLDTPDRLYLFTTRTHSIRLFLRETELFPFLFIGQGEALTFTSAGLKSIVSEVVPAGRISALDIKALRKEFFNRYNELPSMFSIMTGAHYSFTIIIMPNSIAEHRQYLKFRNSFGGYEVVEVTGKGEFVPEFGGEDDWQTMNTYGFYEDNRKRLSFRHIVEVEAGYQTKEELGFLLDMVCSEEIYFLHDNIWMRCLVLAENPRIPLKTISPGSLSLKIRMITEEEYFSPRLDFEYPESPHLVNLTRPGYPKWNGNGLFFEHLPMLYGE